MVVVVVVVAVALLLQLLIEQMHLPKFCLRKLSRAPVIANWT